MSSKHELDANARSAGFPDADYPYYSTPNGCGPDGWKNRLVPDRSHFFTGADWSAACNQHDRDYMTMGFGQERADNQLREHMEHALAAYLAETVKQTTKRLVKRTVTELIPVKRTRRVKEAIGKFLKHPRWRTIVETVTEEVKREVEEWVDDVKLVKRAATLSPDQIAAMQLEVGAFYLVLRAAGKEYYDQSQKDQQRYQTWLDEGQSN